MAAFQRISWGPMKNQHDRGTDLFALVRDERGAELGTMVGLQVKTGEAATPTTYFAKPQKDANAALSGWWYYDANRARVETWASHAIPHMIVLHDLDTRVSYWAHITPDAIVLTGRGGKPGKGAKVFVPAANTVDEDHRAALLAVAATLRSPVSWEGSLWRGSDSLVPAELLRHALVVPRLVAPHPNADPSLPPTPEQAVALLLNGQADQLARLAEAFAETPSLTEAAESPDWRWRFVGAIGQRVTSGEINALLAAVEDAPDPPSRAASSVAAASALIEHGRTKEAITRLETALHPDDVGTVDHAWLTTQHARACADIGRINQARTDAIAVQTVRLTAPDDVTASAMAGAAIALLFNTSWAPSDITDASTDDPDPATTSPTEDPARGLVPAVTIDEPDARRPGIGAAIEAADTAATWWRTQTTSWGLNALADRTFNAWAGDQSTTFGAPDTVRDKLVSASLSASHIGDHGAWCHQAGLLGQATLVQVDRHTHPSVVADALSALRRAGNEGALKLAVRHLAADGPAEAITLAAAEARLEVATRTTATSDLALLQYGGDLVDDETATRIVAWLLNALADPTDFENRTAALYVVQFRLAETLAGIATRLFHKPPVRPPPLRHFWAWLRTSSNVIVSSCC